MIGERHAAQSREQNWQRTFQSPSAYLFRYFIPPISLTSVRGTENSCNSCQEMENEPVDPHNEKWRLGAGHITIDQITLVALEHVSKGSWQPHFYVNV